MNKLSTSFYISLFLLILNYPLSVLAKDNQSVTLVGIANNNYLEILFTLEQSEKPDLINLAALDGKKIKLNNGYLISDTLMDAKNLYKQDNRIFLNIKPDKNIKGNSYVSSIGYFGKKNMEINYSENPSPKKIESDKKDLYITAKELVKRNKPSGSNLTDDYINSYILRDQFEIVRQKNNYFYFMTYTFMGKAPYVAVFVDSNKNILWSDIYYGNEKDVTAYRLIKAFDFISDEKVDLLLLHSRQSSLKMGYSILYSDSNNEVHLIGTDESRQKYLKKFNGAISGQIKLK